MIYIVAQVISPLTKNEMPFQHQYSQKTKVVSSALKRRICPNYLSLSLTVHVHFSFVLRLSTLRILRLLLWVLIPPLRSSLHGYRLASPSSFHHILHVRSVAQILVELTDVAADVLVGLEAERND